MFCMYTPISYCKNVCRGIRWADYCRDHVVLALDEPKKNPKSRITRNTTCDTRMLLGLRALQARARQRVKCALIPSVEFPAPALKFDSTAIISYKNTRPARLRKKICARIKMSTADKRAFIYRSSPVSTQTGEWKISLEIPSMLISTRRVS